MNVLPLLTGLVPRSAWTPDQARRARARMLKLWPRYLAQCHGVWALQLGSSPTTELELPLQALRMARVWQFGRSFQASIGQWPVQPASLDLVIWRVSAADIAQLPTLIGQMNLALGASARVLIWVEGPLLNSWCQIGMPLCHGHDWLLRQTDWGDARKLTWLPARWSSRWSASWQIWLPQGAQWTLQLWQRESSCPTAPSPKQRVRQQRASDLRWQPQSTIDHSP